MKKLRIVLSAVLALGLIVGISGIIRQQKDHQTGAEDYAAAQELAQLPAAPAVSADPEAGPDTGEPAVNLAPLQEVNSDVVGWLEIPGTELSYPLVQTADNDYYLTHTWKKESSSVGAIFLDCRSDAAFSDFNTLIYGHRMRDGSMFGSLRNYQKPAYWEAAPSITLTDAQGTHRYDIFAAYQARVDAALYLPGADAQERAEEILRFAAENNVLDTGLSPSADDRILTLVTCTGSGYSARWIVQAVLAET